MLLKNPKINNQEIIYIIILLLIIFTFSIPVSFSAEYDPQNVTSRVNITNAWPEITTVTPEDPINLVKGTTKTTWCNGTGFDYNGWDDVTLINATLFHSSSTHYAGDNYNFHYTNNSCSITEIGGNDFSYSCSFQMEYFALNGTWTCNVTVQDTQNGYHHLSNTTTLNPLWAINLTAEVNFGDLSADETSSTDEVANITNLGNQNASISVSGYGLNPGDGLAMVCQSGNISIENERWSTNQDEDWNVMTALSNSFETTSLIVPKQTVKETLSINSTYWKLYASPVNRPFGLCNGTIVFAASN